MLQTGAGEMSFLFVFLQCVCHLENDRVQPLPLHLQVAVDFPDASCDAQIVLRRFQGGVRGLDPAPAWNTIQSQVDSTVTDAGRSNCRVGGRHTAHVPVSVPACLTECVCE